MNRSLVPVLLLALACSGGADEAGKQRVFSRDADAARSADLDWSRPERTLAIDAGEAAQRLGSFDWTAAVVWTVTRDGEPPRRVNVAEKHTVRQLVDGSFEVTAEIDPGEGENARQGRHVLYVGGMTYAKGLFATAFRERPTDRGRDAARFRDESFTMAADVARLLGPGFRVEPAGEATVLGRPARRFTLGLEPGVAMPAATVPFGRSTDDDTKRRLAFLEGRTPLAASGELLADAETGVPLQVDLKATFGVASDPKVRAEVALRTQMRALGDRVAAVAVPKKVLPDERKPPGVSDALQAAGLRERGREKTAPAEPPDEAE